MMYSYPYTYFDQYRIIEGELYLNFGEFCFTDGLRLNNIIITSDSF